MLEKGFDILIGFFRFLLPFVYLYFGFLFLFFGMCLVWFLIFKYKYGMQWIPSGQRRIRKRNILVQLLVDVPRRYVLDRLEREPGYFYPRGIHMFCGEQGCGKTIAAVHMIQQMQKQYPMCKTITNFGLTSENTELKEWQQLLEYTNGHKGVVVGIDEIQNWFMSGLNKLPEQMLEVATQNRKNNRIICCTAQVFTRVNKGLREQVTMVYNPHTFFGCFTIVVKRKPKFDSEGNVIEMKFRGLYSFVHTDELRSSYDTYKVIHTLAKEGFKDPLPQNITNVYVAADGKKR